MARAAAVALGCDGAGTVERLQCQLSDALAGPTSQEPAQLSVLDVFVWWLAVSAH